MSRIRTSVVALTLLALPACFNSTEPVSSDSSFTVVNATLGTLVVNVDSHYSEGLSMNAMSSVIGVPSGVHHIRVSTGVSNPVDITLETTRFPGQMLVVYPRGGGPSTAPATTVLVDSSTYMSNGKSQLRVANLAAKTGAVEIWRSEPGSPGSRIMSPFPSGTASSYFEGDPGVWEVWTTAVGGATKTASSGPIEIPALHRRTVLVLDSPAGPRFVAVDY